MKKLKFFALALVAAFGMASCGDEEDSLYNYSEATIVMGGGDNQDLGSFYTFDKGVQKKEDLGSTATNVIFCFNTLTEDLRFISGTIAKNEIVSAQASETKFAVIGDATPAKFEKLTDADFESLEVLINRKLEKGKKAVAFKNAKCQGFFEVVSYDAEKEILTLSVWTASEKAE